MIQKRHFHTFDALRFFACFKVFLQHLPIYSFPLFNILMAGGGIGVQFFFVLSGFLITYIIYEEKRQTGYLNLKNFFIRRILRIWPLFYLMIGFAFITPYILRHINLANSDIGYTPNWTMSLLFLENYKMMATHENPNISPLAVMWSLCVEEHFYIIWGLLLYYIPIKKFPIVIAICLFTGIISRYIYVQQNIPTSDILTNIDLFAFGSIPAYLILEKGEYFLSKIETIPFGWKILYAILVLVIVGICSQAEGDKPFIYLSTLLGLIFSGIIILTLPQKTRFRISDGNMLSKLGIYTYGFYLYHTLVINLFRRVFEKADWPLTDVRIAVTFTILTFTISIGCSMASYYFFEKPFLRLKKYFK